MPETQRSLTWRWGMLVLTIAFAWAWPTTRPANMEWVSWVPAVWLAGFVWLGWSVKNWLLGLIVGLIALFHPSEPMRGVAGSSLGLQLAGLPLVAAWCAQLGELVWHPQAGRKSWAAWTVVGGMILLLVGKQGLLALALALALLWASALAFVLLWWWRQRGKEQRVKKLLALASPIVISGMALAAQFVWPSRYTTAPLTIHWKSVLLNWPAAVASFLPLPGYPLSVWLVTAFLVWGWWRSWRRSWQCAREEKPPAALTLALSAPLLAWMSLADTNISLAPLAAMLLGYLVFDVLQSTLEKMRLPPPDASQSAQQNAKAN